MATHQTRVRSRRRSGQQRWMRPISLAMVLLALALLVRLAVLHLPPALLPWIIDGMCAAVVLLAPPIMLVLLVSVVIHLERSQRRRRPGPVSRPPASIIDHEIVEGDIIIDVPGNGDS